MNFFYKSFFFRCIFVEVHCSNPNFKEVREEERGVLELNYLIDEIKKKRIFGDFFNQYYPVVINTMYYYMG